jgi:hypothetical protein
MVTKNTTFTSITERSVDFELFTKDLLGKGVPSERQAASLQAVSILAGKDDVQLRPSQLS